MSPAMRAQAARQTHEVATSCPDTPPVPAPAVVLALQARVATAFAAPPRRFDIASDLTQAFGTPPWWRGVGVLAMSLAAALVLAPRPGPLANATALNLDAPAREAFAEQLIAPSGDIGGHMGPTVAVVPMAELPERPRIALTARTSPALGLATVLARAGVGASDAVRAAALLPALLPGTPLDITLGAHAAGAVQRPLEHLAVRARFDLALALTRRGDALALSRTRIAVDATPLRVRGRVGPSLFLSAQAAGAPPAAIQQYLQALAQSDDLDALRPDDTFDLVLAYQRAAGGQSQPGPLLYAGLDADGRPAARLVRWESSFVDAFAPNAQRSGFVMPVANARVTSGYGMRFHPILGYTRMHQGIDLAAPWGTPIRAVADGVVEWAGPHGGHGNFVRLEHSGDMGTGYAHMSRIAVAPGERVRAGEVIGYVGMTGLATGPHLHFEVYRGGQVVDPASARFAASAGLSAQDRAVLQARLGQLLRVVPGAALRPLRK